MKVLNLYSGIGGNRMLWKGHQVTGVENDPLIASIYKKLFPRDNVIIADAHEYLRTQFSKFDFIWSSRPCVTHSRLQHIQKEKVFPDMALYEEILFLKAFFKGLWCVENVRGYYAPLIQPTFQCSRHLLWSNFTIPPHADIHWPGFGSSTREREAMVMKLKWMGYKLRVEDFKGIERPRQIVDNCVHPIIGQHIIKYAR